jgi:hypothetical protein
MELVFAIKGVAGATAFAPTVEFTAVVPAPGLLTDVATDGPLIAELRTGDLCSSLSKNRVSICDQRMFTYLSHSGERTNTQSPMRDFRDSA